MEIIDTVLAQITEHQGTGSSVLLAQALASACSRHYTVSFKYLVSSLLIRS